MFLSLGQEPSPAEIKQMIQAVDENSDGTVDFEEFLMLMCKQLKKEYDREEELVEVFKVFDIDNNGQISDQDLATAFEKFNEPIGL